MVENTESSKPELTSEVKEIKEDPATFERIKAKLEEMKIDFKLTTVSHPSFNSFQHEPVLTS